MAFAKKMAGLLTGASSTPSRQPFSVSWENDRLSPSSDVNTMSAHSRPEATLLTSSESPVCESVAPYTVSTSNA